MKAIQLIKYGSSKDSFKINEIPIPNLINKEDVLVKVHAFGINFADIMARKGLYRASPALPAVLGYEVVGIVEKTKDPKNNHLIGKRVLALTRFGGYAQYTVTTALGLIEIPKSVKNGIALALATQYCTALIAVQKTDLEKNDLVLIHSASGGVGTALTQLLKQKGCKIIGLTRNESKLTYLKSNGVDFPINTTKKEYNLQIQEAFPNQKVNGIFNSVGGKTFKKDMQLLDNNGTLVFFGISDRTNQKKGLFPTLLQMFKIGKIHPAILILKSQSISGLNLLEIADKKPQQLQNALKELINLLETKKINPVAANEFSLEQISEAHSGMENAKFTGKTYINILD
jgi:NADPH2:quinone reductase